MGLKDFFGNLKSKSQDIASNAIKKVVDEVNTRVEGPEEIEDPAKPRSIPPPGAPPANISASRSHPPSAISQSQASRSADPNRGPLQVSEQDDSVYVRRSSVVAEIEERYGRFGNKIASYLLTQLMLPGGAKRIVEKLGMRPKGFDSGDKSLIEEYLDKNGADAFSTAVGLRLTESSGSAPPPKADGTGGLKVRTLETRRRDDSTDEVPATSSQPRSLPSAHPVPKTPYTPPGARLTRRVEPDSPTGGLGAAALPQPRPGTTASVIPPSSSGLPPGVSPVALSGGVIRRSRMAPSPTGAPQGELRRANPENDTREVPPPPSAVPGTAARALRRPTQPPPDPPSDAVTVPPRTPPPNEEANDLLSNMLDDSSRRLPRTKPPQPGE